MLSSLVFFIFGFLLVASQCTAGLPNSCDVLAESPPESILCEGGSGVSDGSFLGTCCPTVDTTTVSSVTLPTTGATTTAACADRLNPRTGVSDCPATAYLCNNSVYYDLMTYQCPRTCGRCGVATTTAASTATTCVDEVNPVTGVSECPSRVAYCTNAAYVTFMRTECPRTCGYCTSG